jgi:predicted HicB family RNase H-like nuclease
MIPDKEFRDYAKSIVKKRANDAEFFLDILIEKGIINLDRVVVKDYFIQWFLDNKDFDLQIENGDFAIEDGDLKFVPDFKKDDIADFIKWFNSEKTSFIEFLNAKGIQMDKSSSNNTTIINKSKNVIVNNSSQISNQTLNSNNKKESIWAKKGVYVAILGIIIAIIIAIFENWQTIKNMTK